MKFATSICCLAALSLCACQTKIKEYPLPPNTEVLENIPMESNANVMRTASVKAYPVARYVDRANPDILHEQHVIYRRERPETWRLYHNYQEPILAGPAALRSPIASRAPISQELSAELSKQKIVSQQLLAVKERSSQGDTRATELLQVARSIEADNQTIKRKMDDHNLTLAGLRKDMDLIKADKKTSIDTPPAPLPSPSTSPVPPTSKSAPSSPAPAPVAPSDNDLIPVNPQSSADLEPAANSGSGAKTAGWGLPFLKR